MKLEDVYKDLLEKLRTDVMGQTRGTTTLNSFASGCIVEEYKYAVPIDTPLASKGGLEGFKQYLLDEGIIITGLSIERYYSKYYATTDLYCPYVTVPLGYTIGITLDITQFFFQK